MSAVPDDEAGNSIAKSQKRTREEDDDVPLSKRRLGYASGAAFIDGNEVNTPKANRALEGMLEQE